MRNHYPLYDKGLASEYLIPVRIETPAIYMSEDVHLDYPLTIKSKGPANHREEAALRRNARSLGPHRYRSHS